MALSDTSGLLLFFSPLLCGQDPVSFPIIYFLQWSLLIRLEKVVFTFVAVSGLDFEVPPTGHLQGGDCNDMNCHYGAAGTMSLHDSEYHWISHA